MKVKLKLFVDINLPVTMKPFIKENCRCEAGIVCATKAVKCHGTGNCVGNLLMQECACSWV